MPLPEDSASDAQKKEVSLNFANFVNREEQEAVFVELLRRGEGSDL